MFRSLAQQLGVALLAICLASAPVLGAMPRCCQTGAVRGSGNCCCGPAASAEEPRSCCQAEEKGCCASSQDEATDESTDSQADRGIHAGSAPCQCKALSQPPAITASKDQTQTGDDHVSMHAPEATAATVLPSLVRALNLRQAAPPGISLQKIYCRWTV